MSYQKPEIWTEVKGEYGTSWRTTWEEAEAVYPELMKHLEKREYGKGEYYDDGASFTYKVKPYNGTWTIWKNPKRRGGGFNRPRQFQQTQSQQPAGQKTLSDTEVSFQEEVIKWMQKIEYKIDRLLAENNIDPAGIKPASSLKNNHGNEMSGVADTLNMPQADIEDDGLPEVQTPSGVPEIDAVTGTEQEST